MKKPTKLRPISLDITFCKSATRACANCATCARNLNRYAIHKCFRISVFAEPPCAFTASDCDYYLQDARKPEAAE